MSKVAHLRELIDERDRQYAQRFEAQALAVSAALAAQEKFAAAQAASAKEAIEKAEMNTDAWKASANEWRGAMGDRERNFVHRSEKEALEKELAALTSRLDRIDGRSGGLNAGWGYLLGAISLISALLAIAAFAK